jgi:hypothetical protein
MNKKKVLPVVLAGSILGETVISTRHYEALAPQAHTEVEITVPFAAAVSPVSASGGLTMKLKVGKAMPLPLQRRDTGKWFARGMIAVHNDSECVSVDLVILPGAEFDSKEEASRDLINRADRNYVIQRLTNGAAALLHQSV